VVKIIRVVAVASAGKVRCGPSGLHRVAGWWSGSDTGQGDPSTALPACAPWTSLSSAIGPETLAGCWPGMPQFEWQGAGRLRALVCQL